MTRRLEKAHRQCFCENPCTASSNAVAWYTYILKRTFITYPGQSSGTEEWDDTYKIRTVVEEIQSHQG